MSEIAIPLLGDPASKSLTTGHYRIYGTIPWFVPDFIAPFFVDTVVGKEIEIRDFIIDGETWKADVIINENPVPVVLIVGGVLAAAIVGGVALTVTKIERIVEMSPGVLHGVTLGGLGLVSWLLFR